MKTSFNEWLFEKLLKEMSDPEAEQILGIKRGDPNLTAVWKKLAVQHHPDRGGDLKMAQKVNAAHDVLKGPPQTPVWPSNWKTGDSSGSRPTSRRNSGSRPASDSGINFSDPRNDGSGTSSYYNTDSKYKTPNSVPPVRRQEMEKEYEFHDQITEFAEANYDPKMMAHIFVESLKKFGMLMRYAELTNHSNADVSSEEKAEMFLANKAEKYGVRDTSASFYSEWPNQDYPAMLDFLKSFKRSPLSGQ